jgi:CRT-like, chloroquine-resistance transporter-like
VIYVYIGATFFPKGKIMVMAALDVAHLTMMVTAAAKVAPPLTAILMQAAVPFTLIASCR